MADKNISAPEEPDSTTKKGAVGSESPDLATRAPERHFPQMTGTTSTSRYGAEVDDLAKAAGVLRGRAAKTGVELAKDMSAVDLAAAVIAADAWMWLCGAKELDIPAGYGPAAVAALAALLARAAGHRRYITGATFDLDEIDLARDSIGAAEDYLDWAEEMAGEGSAVLRRVAADLSAGAGTELTREEKRLAAFAALLDITAGIGGGTLN